MLISCFQTGCESTPRIFHRRAIFFSPMLHIFFDVCVLASLLFCFSVCFFFFFAFPCFSAFMFLCFSASPLFCFSAFLFFFASLLLHCSASLLFAVLLSVFACFSASLISIYRIYLLEPMFWFETVFQLFTSMILPARLQLQRFRVCMCLV